MNKPTETKVKNITLGYILAWILGLLFLIGGVVMLFTAFISGVIAIVCAMLLLPPANKFSSHRRGNGLLGIYIYNKKNSKGLTDNKGRNPFNDLYITKNGQKIYLSSLFPTYDWVMNSGYLNMGKWIEEAAKKAGR